MDGGAGSGGSNGHVFPGLHGDGFGGTRTEPRRSQINESFRVLIGPDPAGRLDAHRASAVGSHEPDVMFGRAGGHKMSLFIGNISETGRCLHECRTGIFADLAQPDLRGIVR